MNRKNVTAVLVRGLGWLAVSLVASWAIMLLWWALLSPSGDGAKTLEIVVPEGTAAAVAEGRPAPFIPTSLSLAKGGSLRVINNDVVEHDVGGYQVPAGRTVTFKANATGTGTLTCTIHPSGYLSLDLTERPSLASTILPTLLLGVPAGIALAVVVAIAGKLNLDDEELVHAG
ncbi:MAG: hypothetical protein HY875_10955 [Chloroflexi bacterium]|nr:hypothetical protein [Chloroflexota bacterium]